MADLETRFPGRISPRLVPLLVLLTLSLTSCATSLLGESGEKIAVDCDFPAGNIVLDSIENATVSLHQDVRDTQGDWFYWYFRVRGAAGRTLTFRFVRSNVIGTRGPAVSLDGGRSWKWLGMGAVEGQAFHYTFPKRAKEVRFSFAMPYTESNLKAFLRRHRNNTRLKVGVLCRTAQGRDVELLRVGRLDGRCKHRVLLTCRHHACEMMANYALEGIIEAVLARTEDGKWFGENVEFLIVPFVDKDGVEDGDQGKNRKPHDHNRDYAGESIYPSVGALRQMVPQWSEGCLRFALDMHCPYIRGTNNEWIYFVGGPDKAIWDRVGDFSRILEEARQGPLPYSARNNLPYGKAWNTESGPPRSCSRWAALLPGIWVATTVEIPYATASEGEVTAESARAFGHDLARALRRYLESMEKPASPPKP